MATVSETCEFETVADQLQFTTQTNGDTLIIRNLKLTQEQATSLAWLVNADNEGTLSIEIKVK